MSALLSNRYLLKIKVSGYILRQNLLKIHVLAGQALVAAVSVSALNDLKSGSG